VEEKCEEEGAEALAEEAAAAANVPSSRTTTPRSRVRLSCHLSSLKGERRAILAAMAEGVCTTGIAQNADLLPEVAE